MEKNPTRVGKNKIALVSFLAGIISAFISLGIGLLYLPIKLINTTGGASLFGCGAMCLLPFSAIAIIIAITTGIVFLVRINKSGGEGNNLVITGIILGVLSMLLEIFIMYNAGDLM